jgi:hypothetical protein
MFSWFQPLIATTPGVSAGLAGRPNAAISVFQFNEGLCDRVVVPIPVPAPVVVSRP